MKRGQDYTGVSVVYFCHDGAGNVLMSKRSIKCRDEHGMWDIGGGGLETHDSVEGTLRREIKEEYCTDVLDFEFLGFREVHRGEGDAKTHWIALDYKVLIDREKAANGEPEKFDAVDWFRLDRLPTPLHSQFPFFLDKYRARLVQ